MGLADGIRAKQLIGSDFSTRRVLISLREKWIEALKEEAESKVDLCSKPEAIACLTLTKSTDIVIAEKV